MTYLPFLFAAIAIIPITICVILHHTSCYDLEVWVMFSSAALALGLISAFAVGLSEVQADHDAKFINAQYGTSYTANEMFWNGEDIKAMVIGRKQRIEITQP